MKKGRGEKVLLKKQSLKTELAHEKRDKDGMLMQSQVFILEIQVCRFNRRKMQDFYFIFLYLLIQIS